MVSATSEQTKNNYFNYRIESPCHSLLQQNIWLLENSNHGKFASRLSNPKFNIPLQLYKRILEGHSLQRRDNNIASILLNSLQLELAPFKCYQISDNLCGFFLLSLVPYEVEDIQRLFFLTSLLYSCLWDYALSPLLARFILYKCWIHNNGIRRGKHSHDQVRFRTRDPEAKSQQLNYGNVRRKHGPS